VGQPRTSDPTLELVSTDLGPIAVAAEGRGAGLPVLGMHGIPGSARDFRYLGPHLAPRLRLLRLEMPGFGESPPGVVDTVDGWSRVPGAVADALGLERYLLLGHSFGGGAALLAARRDPERVAGVALLASMAHRPHRALDMPIRRYAVLAAALRWPVIRWPLAALVRRQYRARGLPEPRSCREAALHLGIIASVHFPTLESTARTLKPPVLCAFCSDDRLVQPTISRELGAMLPDAVVLELPTGGHHLQKHRAAEVAGAILERFA
jgi:pimeloyl-ACP methyl ester carboxylesterase